MQTTHIADLIEKFNIIKNHIDRIQINSRSISIYIKINGYNHISHTQLWNNKTVLKRYIYNIYLHDKV